MENIIEYKKQEFKEGQILTHEHLNHMEEGIEAATNRVMSGEYNLVPVLGEDGILCFVATSTNKVE